MGSEPDPIHVEPDGDHAEGELVEVVDFDAMSDDALVEYALALETGPLYRLATMARAPIPDEILRTIRREERHRLARLLEENEPMLTEHENGPVKLIAFLLRLDHE